SISLAMIRGVSNRGKHAAGCPAPTVLLAVIQRVTAHQGLVRTSPVSARLLSRMAFAGHLNIDLVELLGEQLMAQPVTGQLQQSQGIGLGGVDLNADASGILTDLDLQAAQLGRVETNSGNLLLIVQLQLNVVAQGVQHLLATLRVAALELHQPLGERLRLSRSEERRVGKGWRAPWTRGQD